MTSSPSQGQLLPHPQSKAPGCSFVPRQSLSHPAWDPAEGGGIQTPAPSPSLHSGFQDDLAGPFTSQDLLSQWRPSFPAQLCCGPSRQSQRLIPSPACPSPTGQRPHLSPRLCPPGCTTLQGTSPRGRGLPRQACTLRLLGGLLDASPIGRDAVDRAGLGATTTGGRAGRPGPRLPAGREQGSGEAGPAAGPGPGSTNCHTQERTGDPPTWPVLTSGPVRVGGGTLCIKGQAPPPAPALLAISHHRALVPTTQSLAAPRPSFPVLTCIPFSSPGPLSAPARLHCLCWGHLPEGPCSPTCGVALRHRRKGQPQLHHAKPSPPPSCKARCHQGHEGGRMAPARQGACGLQITCSCTHAGPQQGATLWAGAGKRSFVREQRHY